MLDHHIHVIGAEAGAVISSMTMLMHLKTTAVVPKHLMPTSVVALHVAPLLGVFPAVPWRHRGNACGG